MRARLRRSLTAKLLAAELLIVLAGSGTLLLVSLAIGPGIFRNHVHEVLKAIPADVAHHLDIAFAEATIVALGIGIAAAIATAIAVSAVVSVRIVRPIGSLAESAQRVAQGAYDTRVAITGDDELARLGSAFNQMAGALSSAESRRRSLLTDLAHELRTPLATIGGYVEGLADGVVRPEPATWAALQVEVSRLGRLVDDLNTVSRAEERQLDLRLVRVRPGALAEAAIRAAAPLYAAKGVVLAHDAAGGLPEVEVDLDRIGEVLGNLLENALRHTLAGGRVGVTERRSASGIELVVSDDGEGIAAEHVARVFERFYRADPARSRAGGGSGIGLTIARAITEAQGGRIHAESAGPGQGSTFTVWLPAAR